MPSEQLFPKRRPLSYPNFVGCKGGIESTGVDNVDGDRINRKHEEKSQLNMSIFCLVYVALGHLLTGFSFGTIYLQYQLIGNCLCRLYVV